MDLLTRIREEQLENTLAGPVTSDEVFEGAPEEIEGGMVFETSGRSGEPKRIPYADVEHVLGPISESLRLAGFSGHVALNLGAPLPHPTGWGLREAMERLGGRAANDHFRDVGTALEDGSPGEVTAVFGVPSVAEAVGREIAADHGPPSDLFPNVERIATAGDLLTENRRDTLRELWGADVIREIYGASEFMSIGAAVDDTRRLVPFVHRFVLEIVPDDDPDEIVDVRDVEGERRGSLLLSDPAREPVDLARYRIGDKVAVHEADGDDGLPRLTVLGREDDSINLAGALLYPAQIHGAVREAFGPGVDWVVKASDREHPKLDFYIVGGDGDSEAFLDALFERNVPVREAYRDVGVVERIDVHYPGSREEIPGLTVEEGIKSQHVVFDDSYTDTT